jgi:hypothetical protein
MQPPRSAMAFDLVSEAYLAPVVVNQDNVVG